MAEKFRTPCDGDSIYYKTLTEAFKEGETEEYRESRRADRDACRDIEHAVSENTEEGRLEEGDWEAALVDEYGAERLRYLLAATVRAAKSGEFTKAQRDWAKGVRISEDAYVNANNRLAKDGDHDLSGFLDFVIALDSENAKASSKDAKPAGDVSAEETVTVNKDNFAKVPSADKEAMRAAKPMHAVSSDEKTENAAYSTKDPSADNEAARAAQGAAKDLSANDGKGNTVNFTKVPSVDNETARVERQAAKPARDVSAKETKTENAVYSARDPSVDNEAARAAQKPARGISVEGTKTENAVYSTKDPSGDKDIERAAHQAAKPLHAVSAEGTKKENEMNSTKDPSVYKEAARVAQEAAPQDGPEEEEDRVEISMPWGAVLRIYDNRTAYVKMPKGRFEGYAFSVPLKYVARDGDSMTLRLPRDFKANLKDRERRESVSSEELAASLSTASLRDYDIIYEPNHDGNDIVTFTVPSSYLLEEKDNYCRFALPSSGESVFIKSGFCREDGSIRSLAVPGGALIRIYDENGGASERRITPREIAALYAAAKEEDADTPGYRPVTIAMSSAALSREYTRNIEIRMPRGELFGYGFYIPKDAVSKGAGDTLSLTLPEGQTLHLKNGEGEKRDIPAGELSRYVSMDAKDYEEPSGVTRISVPAAALVQKRERSYLFVLPRDKSATFFLGASLVTETSDGFLLSIPSRFSIEIKGTGETVSPEELKGIVEGADPSEFARPDAPQNAWRYVEIPQEALVFRNERRMYFRMPDGPLDRGAYYYPMALVTEEGNRFRLSVPVDQTVSLYGYSEGPVELNADAFINSVQGKGPEWYRAEFCEPELSGYGVFTENRERKLRENIPEEMKNLPNWVVVRTPWNRDKGKREKFLISPVTGRFAQSNDPSTWCDFETAMSYGKSNGADTLAFALAGDGICCLDMDKCLDSDGNLSPAAENALKFVPEGSYRELSVSGNGLHVFGKLAEDLDVTSFSKDRKLEFYRRDHFISVTGDCEQGSRELGNFSSADMQMFLKNNFEKRKVYRNAGKGVAGLSRMSDRDVVERACSARGGDVFLDLYKGRDVKGNRSNSDMAFMNRLAFWCGGDADQMLRIFYSSGLYRPEKSREYYEYTAAKALEGVADRYDPSRYTSSSPMQRPQDAKGGEDKGDGKGDG